MYPLTNWIPGPDPAYVWISLVWVLTVAITYALVGRLSDVLGRRWFFLGGNALGLLGAIIAGTAHRIPVLIGGSALIGVAGAVQLSFPIVLGELVPNKHRPYANAAMYLCALPFSGFGSVIARSFVLHTKYSWRWSYYLDIILNGLTVILYFFFYHPPTLGMLHSKHKPNLIQLLDIGGILLFAAGLLIFLLGISWGGEEYPWRSGQVIGTIVGGGVLLIIFVVYGELGRTVHLGSSRLTAYSELFAPIKYPLMPLRLWKNGGYVATILTASVAAMIYYSMNVLWPTQITALYSTDMLTIGWMSCAVGGPTILGNIVGSLTCKNLGRQKWQMIVSATCMTAFVGGLAASNAHTKALAAAFVCLGSFFVGAIEGISFSTAPLCLEPEDIGLAAGMLGSVRSALSTIATAIYVAILTNKLNGYIPKYVGAAAAEAGLSAQSLTEVLSGFEIGKFTFPGITSEVVNSLYSAYQKAYSKSFQVVYLASVAFGICAIVAAFFSPNMEHRFDGQVARRLHGRDIKKKEDAMVQQKSIEKV